MTKTKTQKTILIVEDTLTYQQALKRAFKKDDYNLICTATGEKALDLVHQETPDLIILDLTLPGMGGEAVCRALKMHTDHKMIPVMMLTIKDDEKAAVDSIAAGADMYVNKAESIDTITRRAQALLKLNRAARNILKKDVGEDQEGMIDLKEKKILLIDDDITYLEGLRRQLISEGYNVTTGRSGEECLKRLEDMMPDVLLLDLRMPEIDGIDVCRQLRMIERFRDLPIVMLTASDQKKDIIHSFESGVNDYVVKTGDFVVIKSRIFSIIRRRHMEQLNKQLNEQVIRQGKLAAMGKLASIVGHELRGPLGVIGSSVHFLKMKLAKGKDAKIVKHLKILDEEIITANRIIEDILDSARIKEPKLESVSVSSIIDGALKIVAVPKGITMKIKQGKGSMSVKVDPLQMKRVFSNLMTNAVQAMSEGGTLTIESKINTRKGMAVISVQDTGPGILKKDLKQIFDPLFSTKIKGTGLGLSVCQSTVKNHHGTIDIKTEEGKGTRFMVSLPLS